MKHFITTFYKFVPIENPVLAREQITEQAKSLQILGLMIIGREGLNCTVSAPSEQNLNQFKIWCRDQFDMGADLLFKDSISDKQPFPRFVIKIRDEIVTLGTPDLIPGDGKNHHLSPTEWNEVLKNEKDFLLIDTRNWYETKIGTFKGAINPGIDQFTEFPKFMEAHQVPKDKKLLIFCTGGIRCEKGILELQRQGYDNVYQLEGGIINYMKEYPNDQFEGECFVFDQRVALDAELQPSRRYGLCPHCGQPAAQEIQCKRCDSDALICDECAKLDWKKQTCSKNCAYQLQLHPDRKGQKQPPGYLKHYPDKVRHHEPS